MMQIIVHMTVLKIAEIQSHMVSTQSREQSPKNAIPLKSMDFFTLSTKDSGGGQLLFSPHSWH